MSAADFKKLKREFQAAWSNQADGVPFRIEFVHQDNSTKHVRVGRVELHRVDQPKDPDTKWWGYLAVIRKDPRTASDCLTLKDLCRRAGAALPRSIRGQLHRWFAFPTDQPDDLWLTLLAIVDGVTWPPKSYFQSFNPFEASLNAIEQCGLGTDNPRLPAVADDIAAAEPDALEGETDEEPWLVGYRELLAIAGRRARPSTVRDHLRREKLEPCKIGSRGKHLFRYLDVVPVWSPEQLGGLLPADEDEARKQLEEHEQARKRAPRKRDRTES